MKYRVGSRGRVQGVRTPPGILHTKKTMWFIGVEVEQEKSAPPPKKNPGSTPEIMHVNDVSSNRADYKHLKINKIRINYKRNNNQN